MTTLDPRLVTNALLELLRDATSLPIGDLRLPEVAEGKPWAIVYPVGQGERWGPELWAPDSSGSLHYQVTSVGRTREQCEWMGGLVDRSLLARSSGRFQVDWPDMDGWKVIDRRLVGAEGIDPEGVSPNLVYSQPARYAIHVTPA